jgi:hypothetical protein
VTGETTFRRPLVAGFCHWPPMKKLCGALIAGSVFVCTTALIVVSFWPTAERRLAGSLIRWR